MKRLKTYKLFESLNIDRVDIEDRLIDFKQLGFDEVSIDESSSIILDFDRKETERQRRPNGLLFSGDQYFIRSNDIDVYKSGSTNNSLNIELKSASHLNLNLKELEYYYEEFSHYLRSVYGLIPNYIYVTRIDVYNTTGGGYGGQFLYFKNFDDIRKFLIAQKSIDTENIKVRGFNLGFYRP